MIRQDVIRYNEILYDYQLARSVEIFSMCDLCLEILAQDAQSLTHGC